jgi:hypothetical protein
LALYKESIYSSIKKLRSIYTIFLVVFVRTPILLSSLPIIASISLFLLVSGGGETLLGLVGLLSWVISIV